MRPRPPRTTHAPSRSRCSKGERLFGFACALLALLQNDCTKVGTGFNRARPPEPHSACAAEMSHQQSGVLRVKLTHAIGLKSMDSNGFSDPYIKVAFGKMTHKSTIVKKSLNPRWDETFSFRGNYPDFMSGVLEVQGWDWDRLSRNDPLGTGTLQLSHLESQGLGDGANVVCSVQLKDSQAVPGEVFFEIMWEWDHRPNGPRGAAAPGSRGFPPPSRGGATYATPHGGARGDAARIQQTFGYFDVNRSGYLDYGELRNALRHYGIDASVLQSAEIVRRYDDQPDGKLEMAEFTELVRDLEQGVVRSAAASAARSPYAAALPPVPARVAVTFDECDANRSGYLDYTELRGALLRYGIDVSEPQAASIVRAYDDSPDGKLDLAEFARVVRDIEGGSMRREGEHRTPYGVGGGGGGACGGGYANGGSGYGASAYARGAAARSPPYRPPYRPPATTSYSGPSTRFGGAGGSSSEERGTGALLYLLDVLFRTVLYALATAALVAPDKVVGDADIVARAAGKESAAAAISTVPMQVWYAILGLLLVLLLVSANCCGLRRPIVACFDCQPGPCSRFCHTIMACCRPGYGRPGGYGGYERYADERGYGAGGYERGRGGYAPKPYERV